MRLTHFTRLLLVTGGLVVVGFQGYAAQGYANLFVDGGWLFIIWTLLPFAILFLATRASKNIKVQVLVFLVAAGIITRGSFAYYQSYFVYLDAQSALVFLFVPLEQVVVSAVVLIVAVAENIRSNGKPT